MIIEFCETSLLRHIEGHSKRRVDSLCEKILSEGIWTKPLAVESMHNLVLDGQHRMEVALRLGFKRVPIIRYVYADVSIRSLRKKHQFDWKIVTERALNGDIYPYKTVKHDFSAPLPKCSYSLSELK